MNHSHRLRCHGLSSAAPTILLSDSYNEGYNKGGWSGDDWNKYLQGKHAREAQDEANKSNWYEPPSGGEPRWENDPTTAPGNGGCGVVVLLMLTIPIVATSALAALPSAVILLFITGKILNASKTLSFGPLYKAAFWTSFIYLLIAVILSFAQTTLLPELNVHEKWSIIELFKFFNVANKSDLSPGILVLFHITCILLSALALHKRIRFHPNSLRGYLGSVLITTFIILPILLLLMYFIHDILLKPLLIKHGIGY